MENKTVVGWDASSRSEAALDWAVSREAARRGTIALVFIVEDPNGALDEDEAERQLTEARAAMRDAAERVRKTALECAVTIAAALGPVAVIPDRGGEEGAGIVVGVDGSSAGDAAVAFAASEAGRLGEQLIVVGRAPEPFNVPIRDDVARALAH